MDEYNDDLYLGGEDEIRLDDDDNEDLGIYEENEQQYASEFSASERVGHTNVSLGTYIQGKTRLSDLQKRATMEGLSYEQTFNNYIDAIARKINSDTEFKLSEGDIEILQNRTRNIKYIKNINPIGYVIGYIVSKGGTTIEKKLFNKVINKLTLEFPEANLEQADVLRYGRFWVIVL